MVGCEVEGPLWAVLGCSWGLCGRSGAEKCEERGCLENVLISKAGARSAASGAVLGRSWGLCGRSWAALGAYVGGIEPLLGPMFAILGRSWGLCWRSWAALCASVGRLGRSPGLCWRSWAALGAFVGGLGPLLGPMLAVLGRSWGLCGRLIRRTWLL